MEVPKSNFRLVFRPRDPCKKVLTRAQSQLQTMKYNVVINNNCGEHFANWCVTGEKYSTQTINVTCIVGSTLLRVAPLDGYAYLLGSKLGHVASLSIQEWVEGKITGSECADIITTWCRSSEAAHVFWWACWMLRRILYRYDGMPRCRGTVGWWSYRGCHW